MSMEHIETLDSNWTIIDGTNGIMIYPHNFTILEAIEDYGFGGICSIEVEYGWAARYTMPGYLDCTDWAGVFENEDQAAEHLRDIYEED